MQNQYEVRHWYGFFLALTTAIMWGVLPVFLKLALQKMDPVTITWYRFMVAALFVFLLLLRQNKLPSLAQLGGQQARWLFIASAGLIVNYVFYLKGLDYLNPETAQVLIQLAPFLVMLGGIFLYKEKFSRLEWLGAFILFSGMLLFFNNRLDELLTSVNRYSLGVLMIILAAVTWAVYGLLQKRLLKSMNAKQLTLIMYTAGVVVLLPFSTLFTVLEMNQLQFLALLFCCANTIIGYGAFTEAMAVWHASKVSAVIALAPLVTIFSMSLAVKFWPQYFAQSDINLLAYVGAGLVMLGSILASMGKARPGVKAK
ncbi:DMT family transporter [Neptunicella marina]|uniref:DMT family transporter n=1 Tax=Neptunicella marina TaxID=2125989 RepID=A0A8J6M0C7_9ALTE|nr:DMT family transporter [Neptunicella marina]MBC3764588.1 DMT family transporter [Neptunicella marina]